MKYLVVSLVGDCDKQIPEEKFEDKELHIQIRLTNVAVFKCEAPKHLRGTYYQYEDGIWLSDEGPQPAKFLIVDFQDGYHRQDNDLDIYFEDIYYGDRCAYRYVPDRDVWQVCVLEEGFSIEWEDVAN